MGIDHAKLKRIALEKGERVTKEKAHELEAAALEIFLRERKDPSHTDYADSFFVDRGALPHSYAMGNADNTAMYIEFAVYDGTRLNRPGTTEGYAPLRRSIDVVSSTD